MECDESFFKYDSIIKKTSTILVLQRGKYVYKIYRTRDLKWWFREIAFLEHVSALFKKYDLDSRLKVVQVCTHIDYQFMKCRDYSLNGDEIVIEEAEIEYCVIKFNKLDCATAVITPDLMKRIIHELIFVFAFLNINHVVHRDIKETNFGVKKSWFRDKVFLLDFNMSTLNGIKNNAFTTPRYKDPVLSKSHHSVDERSDVWSFGVMLFQVMAGVSLYELVDKEEDFLDYKKMRKLISQNPIMKEDSFIKRLIELCFKDYNDRLTFYKIYEKFAKEKLFPENLYEILSKIPARNDRIVSIQNSETVSAVCFIKQVALNGREIMYFKNLFDSLYRLPEACIQNETGYIVLMAAVKIIHDARPFLLVDYQKKIESETGYSVSNLHMIKSLKTVMSLCKGDLIGYMVSC